jgi:pyridoxamine--pyruvate transaminase
MGLTPFVCDEWASKTLTAVTLPQGIDGAALRNNIEKKHDILLAGGLGATANTVVRVGHLSMTASSEYLVPTLKALESELLVLGAKVNTGVAASKFTEVFGK